MDTSIINFVFDLDDTLYKERDYTESCLVHIGKKISEICRQPNPTSRMISLVENGDKDVVGTICGELCIEDTDRLRLLKDMQAHSPIISLSPDAADLISDLRNKGQKFSIITDGRSVTQRAKLSSLGLLRGVTCIISEEIGVKKPDQKAFKMIQSTSDSASFVYVADNPIKDFIAPNQLGWQSIMLKDNGRNIHSQSVEVPPLARPQRVVSSLLELIGSI